MVAKVGVGQGVGCQDQQEQAHLCLEERETCKNLQPGHIPCAMFPHLATSKIGGILYRFMSVKRDIVDVDPPKAPQMFQGTHQN